MNNRVCIPMLFLFWTALAAAQEPLPENEQQMENLADQLEAESEDDSYLQRLDDFRRDPLDLNTADRHQLEELGILSGLQIDQLLLYRTLLGPLVSPFELQAVPAWDVKTIKQMLPFVRLGAAIPVHEELAQELRQGAHQVLLRLAMTPEKAKGFRGGSGGGYAGGREKLFFRYQYKYKDKLQFGCSGDKDAGELFFHGPQRMGFDFYSFHLFARRTGILQTVAMGDFTVNLGQGLIHWQGLAFGKGGNVTGIKRQSPVLRPYRSAGEYLFHRGLGITGNFGKLSLTGFVSRRALSGTLQWHADSSKMFISSISTSGYHRTASEIAYRNNLVQYAWGGNARYATKRGQVGINMIAHQYSIPLQRNEAPYQLFTWEGDHWINASLDYSLTIRNMHLFGEAAVDKRGAAGFVQGVMISVDPRMDLALLYRNIGKSYQAINGNAFTESTTPANEKGWYAGVSLRPTAQWRIEAYADFFSFPWLRYRLDAPASGREFLVQVYYQPAKGVEMYTRYRDEHKPANEADQDLPVHAVTVARRQNWRTQLMLRVSPAVTTRIRTELVWYRKGGAAPGTGFLSFADLLYRPGLKRFGGNCRLAWFGTDDYDTRIYAYENDVRYSFSIPALYGRGFRYYLNINYKWSKTVNLWFRWAQSLFRDRQTVGSGLDEITGHQKSEIRVQISLSI